MSKVGLVADALHRFVCRYLCEVLQGYPDLSLSSFIGAAKPDFKTNSAGGRGREVGESQALAICAAAEGFICYLPCGLRLV